MKPLFRMHKQAEEVFYLFRPRISGKKKRVIHEQALSLGGQPCGEVVVSRWPAMEIADGRGQELLNVASRIGFFDYREESDLLEPRMEWHLNFADEELFVAYGSDLFAQDEIQCVEHPILGSIREMLLNAGRWESSHLPTTVDAEGNPTPVLVVGAQRFLAIDTAPINEEGQAVSIYGNNLMDASEELILKACRRHDGPPRSNILAMASLSYGSGEYSLRQIRDILRIAYTGFRAAALESREQVGAECRVVIHTGDWGAGAFGGNKELMAILQWLAADLAGIDQLVFHTLEDGHVRSAREFIDRHWTGKSRDVGIFLCRLHERKLVWGVSDGN